ncbi:hypothetical protein WJ978_21310 [Achromobacter xylosoxidans]
MATSLRRYTELPYLIDYLQSGELALLNPKAWDDRNDSFYIEEYARAKRLLGIYALCLAEPPRPTTTGACSRMAAAASASNSTRKS